MNIDEKTKNLISAARHIIDNIFGNWRPEMFNELRDALNAIEQSDLISIGGSDEVKTERQPTEPMVPLREAVQVIRRYGAIDDMAAEWTKKGYIQWTEKDGIYYGKILNYDMGIAENCKPSLLSAIRSQITNREKSAIKSELVQAEHLAEQCKDHPLMGPSMAAKANELKSELEDSRQK